MHLVKYSTGADARLADLSVVLCEYERERGQVGFFVGLGFRILNSTLSKILLLLLLLLFRTHREV
jgi:hypothetical protein